MERFILTQNGKEVKIGDKLVRYGVVNTPLGKGYIADEITVDEKVLSELLKAGVIKAIDGKPEVKENVPTVPMELRYYIGKIANRLGWKIEKVYNYLNSIDSIMPAAAFSMVLREIAIELDKKYKDHIENSPEIYVISTFDGRIAKANKAHIKNYRNFAAFRSIEDAKIACRITRDILKDMFKSDK